MGALLLVTATIVASVFISLNAAAQSASIGMEFQVAEVRSDFEIRPSFLSIPIPIEPIRATGSFSGFVSATFVFENDLVTEIRLDSSELAVSDVGFTTAFPVGLPYRVDAVGLEGELDLNQTSLIASDSEPGRATFDISQLSIDIVDGQLHVFRLDGNGTVVGELDFEAAPSRASPLSPPEADLLFGTRPGYHYLQAPVLATSRISMPGGIAISAEWDGQIYLVSPVPEFGIVPGLAIGGLSCFAFAHRRRRRVSGT